MNEEDFEELCLCNNTKMSMPIKIGIGVAIMATIGSVITLCILKNKKKVIKN